jgi:hypothetical protein
VHEHRPDPELIAALAKARQILLGMLGEMPCAWALGEKLHGIRSDLGSAIECALDPARAMSAEEHAARLAA